MKMIARFISAGLLMVGMGACTWEPKPAQSKKAASLLAHVQITADGASPELLSEDAQELVVDLFRAHKATRVTTVSTYDKCDIYIQCPGDNFQASQADINTALARQNWITAVAVSDVAPISAAGIPRGIGVVQMQTISIHVSPETLATFPQRGLDVDQVAAAVREIYPGGQATPEMLEELKALKLRTRTGGTVPFTDLATMELQTVEDPIVRSYP